MENKKSFGVMLDCSRNAVMKPEKVNEFVDVISSFGYNCIQLYTEDTYEIKGEPYFGYLRGGYTESELKAIDAHCALKGVELIPCVQTLAHLNQIFRWSRFNGVRDTDDILLADDENTYALIDEMFAVLARCFTSRRVNIGMDEAHMIGRGRFYDLHGEVNRFDIIKKHLERVIGIAAKYGFRCMMWSDMFMRLANGGNYYVYDKPVPQRVKDSVPENVELIYWDYYHDKKSVYDGMFAAHGQLAGDRVGFAGGAWTWVGFAPRNGYTLKTMKPAVKSAAEHGIKDIFLTMWGDNGKECSFYSVLPSLFAIKKMSDGETDAAKIKEEFARIVGEDYDAFMLLDLPSDVGGAKNTPNNPCRYLLYNDIFLGVYDVTITEKMPAEFKRASARLKKHAVGGKYAYLFNAEKLLCDVLAIKCDLALTLRKTYLSGDRDGLKGEIVKIKKLEKALDKFYYAFKELWFTENKPHGFDVQDIRLGGLARRLRSSRERLEDFVAGRIPSIPELEEDLLDPLCRADAEKGAVCQQNYAATATVNVL